MLIIGLFLVVLSIAALTYIIDECLDPTKF